MGKLTSKKSVQCAACQGLRRSWADPTRLRIADTPPQPKAGGVCGPVEAGRMPKSEEKRIDAKANKELAKGKGKKK